MPLQCGDKCMFVRSLCGNEGKIVVVTGYHSPLEYWKGLYYPDADLIVRSLGSPLHDTSGGSEMEGPASSSQLRKLPNVEAEDLEDERELVLVDSR